MDVTETEEQLVSQAQSAVSQCNWVVGECAAKWTQRYARGRTDADFAGLVGLSGDQVFQRRRVWETFGDVYGQYAELKWSHFYAAVNWDDAPECLQWATEQEASVAEMRAWRRSLRGEDLDQPPSDDWGGDPAVSYLSDQPSPVRDPGDFGEPGERTRSDGSDREAADAMYAPFRSGAGSPAPAGDEGDVAVVERPRPSVEDIVQRAARTIKRVNRSLTDEMFSALDELPADVREEFQTAVREFRDRTAAI